MRRPGALRMRYHIDTIPIWDALKLDTECLLCALRRQTEQRLTERSLGASVMSPDTRILVNQTGFCCQHQAMLYDFQGGNRLGHALMMLSHLQTILPKVDKALSQNSIHASRKTALRLSHMPFKTALRHVEHANSLASLTSRCLICDELEALSNLQAENLLHLWKTDTAFRTAFSRSRGLCLPDVSRVLEKAPELLYGEDLDNLYITLKQLLKSSLDSLEKELTWYTQKFDYRNTDKPWGSSKDALERTVNKLRGWCLGSEPIHDDAI